MAKLKTSRSHGKTGRNSKASSSVSGVGSKYISRTPKISVKAWRTVPRKTSFEIVGQLVASAHDAYETILQRVVDELSPSRTEKSDKLISQSGKEIEMPSAESFTADNLPHLSAESKARLTAIKHRAEIRRKQRLAAEATTYSKPVELKMHKNVIVNSSKIGKTIDFQ